MSNAMIVRLLIGGPNPLRLPASPLALSFGDVHLMEPESLCIRNDVFRSTRACCCSPLLRWPQGRTACTRVLLWTTRPGTLRATYLRQLCGLQVTMKRGKP